VVYEQRVKRAADVTLRLAAAVLFASLLYSAWHDVSKAFDGWYYHLPFAGRIAGVYDPSTYALSPSNAHRFEGFPLLAEALQGLAWRVTGRVQGVNLVAFAALPAIAYALRRMWGVPPHLTFLALVAIPLVQIHATANYIDLTANACATLLWLVSYRSVVAKSAPEPRVLALAAALAAGAVNMKFQLVPIAVAGAVPLVALALQRGRAPEDGYRVRVAIVLVALPFVFATPLKNAVLYGNPVWPVELHLFGRSLPHVERAYASSPDWLEHAPRPVRFACSALEIGLRPIASHHRWSLDEWTPPSERGYRMGGFFGAYVLANLGALAYALAARRAREVKVAAAFVLGLTLVTSVMPQSHELRYYLVWMLFLVSVNLVLWARERPLAVGGVAAIALAIVGWSTGGTYLYASGDDMPTYLASRVDGRAIDRIPPGAHVCVARAPSTFLYAPLFHPGKRYTVQEAEDAADCSGAIPLE
jgi:hypothetical protein